MELCTPLPLQDDLADDDVMMLDTGKEVISFNMFPWVIYVSYVAVTQNVFRRPVWKQKIQVCEITERFAFLKNRFHTPECVGLLKIDRDWKKLWLVC